MDNIQHLISIQIIHSLLKPFFHKQHQAQKIIFYGIGFANLCLQNFSRVFSYKIESLGQLKRFVTSTLEILRSLHSASAPTLQQGYLFIQNAYFPFLEIKIRISEGNVLQDVNITRAAEAANILLPYGAGVEAQVYVFFERLEFSIYSPDQHGEVNVT